MLRGDTAYFGYEDNVGLSNGDVELVLPSEYGPRVIHYGLRGKRNVLATLSPQEQRNPTPYGDDWHIYGGHRLWYAPERADVTYYPDNRPVHVEQTANIVTLTQEPEAHSGLEKSIRVELAERGSHVTLRHRLRHLGQRVLELAPWALTAMAPGGRAVFPQASFVPHPVALAPARPLVLWPFTRMSDPRFRWGDRFIELRQDPTRAEPQKVGMYDVHGYLAYALDDQLFVKTHSPRPGPHADFGCNVQTFTNELFLELETLGPLLRLSPGQQVEHEEHWFLFDGMSPLGTTDDELEAALAPVLARIAQELG
jgi:hypothetical protein